MARRPSPCTQAEITKLIKAALTAGIGMDNLAGVKITKEGATLIFGKQLEQIEKSSNEWDEVLNAGPTS